MLDIGRHQYRVDRGQLADAALAEPRAVQLHGTRGSERRPGKAIVYLGEPFESDYIVIRHADLEKVTAKNIDLERWKRKYPWLARQLGLP